MQKHTPEVQKKLNKIVVVLRWLALGAYFELGDGRYAFDEDGSLCFQFKASRPEEDPWYNAESLGVSYFFKKLTELPETTIDEIKANLALNSLSSKRRNI